MRSFRWRLRLKAPIEEAFAALATDAGRERFWAERSREADGRIAFDFPNGVTEIAEIMDCSAPRRFALRYFGAETAFALVARDGGTDLELTVRDQPDSNFHDAYAGWVSVLMNLKSVLDHGTDLRNHEAAASWDRFYVEN